MCKEIDESDRKRNPKVYDMIKKMTNKRISSDSSIKDKGKVLTTEQEILKRWGWYEYDLQTMLNNVVKVWKTFWMEMNEKKQKLRWLKRS